MAATVAYNNAVSVFLQNSWVNASNNYFVVALSSAYVFDANHQTLFDVKSRIVGSPVPIQNRIISSRSFVANIIDFVGQNSVSAAYAAVCFTRNQGQYPDSSNVLLFLNLRNGQTISFGEYRYINITRFMRAFVDQDADILPDVVIPPPAPTAQNPYPEFRPAIPTASTVITKTGLAAIETAVGGDVIAIPGATAVSFKIENKNFLTPVVIWANEGAKISAVFGNLQPVDNGLGNAGIYINNCNNIILRGFEVEGPTVTYGIRVHKSSNIILYQCHVHDNKNEAVYFADCERSGDVDCLVHDTGQSGIRHDIRQDIPLHGWFSIRAEIYNTGKTSPDFGEGLYLGNGTNPTFGPVTGVYVEDCYIHDTEAECIDLKSNVEQAIVLRPRCEDGNIPYNGLITIGSENETTQGEIILDGARTRGVTNRTNALDDRYHVVIGRGNVIVRNCEIDYTNEASQYDQGISLFKTSVNQTFNNVTIEDSNTFGGIYSEKRIEVNVNSADLPVDNPLNLILPQNSQPKFWIDATDSTTFSSIGTNLTEWRDKSINVFKFRQETDANRPTITTRTINGRAAVEWTGNKYMQMPEFTGPQFLLDSMIFAVFDTDISGFSRWVLSFQRGGSRRIGVGVDGTGFFFSHADDGPVDQISIASATGITLLAGYRSGTTQYIIDDAGTTATNANGTDQNELNRWVLGGAVFSGGPSSYFDGAIGEIKMYDYYNATVFASEIAALKTKWGIA